MKIQIDTKAKTIKVDEVVSLKEFFSMVKKLLPEDWQEYKLETNTVINNWNNPVVIERWNTDPWWPWRGTIYCGTGNATTTVGGSNILCTTNNVTYDATVPSTLTDTVGIYNIEA